jgi:polyhydroxyalkanoate synthesis regulator protein
MSLQKPSQMVSDFVSRSDPFFKKISRMFSELLPSPFHSTQRRGKMNQNKISKSDPIVGQIADWPFFPC